MTRLRKALAITAVCLVVLLAVLLRAALRPPPLTENELRGLTRHALAELLEGATGRGGLLSAELAAERAVTEALHRRGVPAEAEIWRPTRPRSDLAFLVTAADVTAWVSPEGLPDPLALLRGERLPVRPEPVPAGLHARGEVLLACLEDRRAHATPDAPDWFTRLENRTAPEGHGGYEILLLIDGRLELDRFAWAGHPTPPEALARYGA